MCEVESVRDCKCVDRSCCRPLIFCNSQGHIGLKDQYIVRRIVLQVKWPFYKTNTRRKRSGKTEVNLSSKWGCLEFESSVTLSMGRYLSLFIGEGLLGPRLRLDTMVAKR